MAPYASHNHFWFVAREANPCDIRVNSVKDGQSNFGKQIPMKTKMFRVLAVHETIHETI